VQRRLSRAAVEHLISLYREGAAIDALALRYEVHRTTVIHHLDQARSFEVYGYALIARRAGE